VGIGFRISERLHREVVFLGAWRFSRDWQLSFEVPVRNTMERYSFTIVRALGAKTSARLRFKGQQATSRPAFDLIVERKLLEDWKLFSRLELSKDETKLQFGLKFIF